MTPVRATGRPLAYGAAVLLAAAAAALAACGGGAKQPESDATKVERTIRTYLTAQVSGDGAAACAVLSPAGKRQLSAVVATASKGLATAPGCEEAVTLVRAAAGSELLGALGRAQVEHVAIAGDRATADVVDGAALARRPVALVRTGGTWLISGVPGLPR